MAGLDWTLLLRSPVFEVYALLLGLVVGSFANVCIHRLPADFEPAPGRLGFLRDLARQALSVVHPPSHCPRCQPADTVVRQRAPRELDRAAGAVPLVRAADPGALSRGRGGERAAVARARRPSRPAAAHARSR